MSRPYEIGPLHDIRVPRVSDCTTANGLAVVAMRYPAVPRFELRMRMPGGTSWDTRQGNRARIAARAAMTGTKNFSEFELARELQRLGCSMSVTPGLDYMSVTGGGLSSNLGRYLGILAEVLTSATFEAHEVDVVKAQVAQSLSIRSSDPASIARDALVHKLYGGHPYGRATPAPASVARVSAKTAAEYFFGQARPRKSQLVIVGDISPARATHAIEDALAKWRGRPGARAPVAAQVAAQHRTFLLDRAGAVQTNIRIGGAALPRGEPGFFDLVLANTIFGGYFSSRLVEKIREERGYSYSPRSSLEHHQGASILTVSADVATEVTAAALNEIRYELNRMVTTEVSPAEIEAARNYVAGVTALSVQTQSGMADYLSTLYSAGLDAGYLRNLRENLAGVTQSKVRKAAAHYLSDRRLTTVLVGDASRITGELESIDDVRIVSG